MNREKEISKAAQNYIITDETCGVGVRTQAFIDKAKWADKYPKSPWHSAADEDLPPSNKNCLFYYQGDLYTGFMRGDNSLYLDYNLRLHLDVNDIKYWMEIPELPNS
jgi:hypothetical protein|nr:MAG TPA: Protein of unknown function (DUF551) [Crassvirales sp.]